MKVKFLSISLFLFVGCKTSPKIFVLDNIGKDRYYLSDSLKPFFKEGYKSPLIAIDGIEFKYQKNLDTIILPLQKSDITDFTFLNKESSVLIYGKSANKGAIVINTKASQNHTSDTTKIDIGY